MCRVAHWHSWKARAGVMETCINVTCVTIKLRTDLMLDENRVQNALN